MNVLASVQMPATPSSSTTTSHNNDLMDDVVELWPATPSASNTTTTANNDNNPVNDRAEVVLAAPSAATTTGPNDNLVDDHLAIVHVPATLSATTPSASVQVPVTPSAGTTAIANNNNPVDDLARILSNLLLPPSSAQEPAVVIRDYLLPCLDTPSTCTLALVHPDLHTILSTPAYFAVRSIHAGFYEINKPSISAKGRHIRTYLTSSTAARFISFVGLPSFAHTRILHLNAPYMDYELADTIRENMPHLTSLSVSTQGIRCVDIKLHGFGLNGFWNTPLVWDLFRCLPKLRELLYPIKKEKYIPSGLHTLHLLADESHGTSLLTSIFQDVHLPSLRCLTLVNFGKITVNSVRHILRACPHLRQLSFRLTTFSGRLEAVYALPLGIESHPDFVDRLPGWSSNIYLDDYYNWTNLWCFVPTEDEGEDEQEGGEGIVMESPLGSLAPLYEDMVRYNTSLSGWEVREEEFGPKKRDLKVGRKRKARGEGWGTCGGRRLGGGEGRGAGGGGGGASVGAKAGGGEGEEEAGGGDNSVSLLRAGAQAGGEGEGGEGGGGGGGGEAAAGAAAAPAEAVADEWGGNGRD